MEESDLGTWEKFKNKLSHEQLLQRQREGPDGSGAAPYGYEDDDSAREGAWYWEQQQRQARSSLLNSTSNSGDDHRGRRGAAPNPIKRSGGPQQLNYFSAEKDNWRQLAADDVLADFDPHKFVAFKSVVKLSVFFVASSVLSYLSVVPSSLPLLDYNLEYKNTLLRVFGSALWPVVLLALIYRPEDANINAVVDQFVRSVFLDYPLLCLVEVLAVTIIRLGVLRVLEPQVFKLCEHVPSIFLPWRLALYDYYPSGLTLSTFLSISNIVAAPLIEEVFKARVLSGAIARIRRKGERGRKRAAAAAAGGSKLVSGRGPVDGDGQPITLRTYLIFMLAGAVGLKVADNIRRVLLYAQPLQRHKVRPLPLPGPILACKALLRLSSRSPADSIRCTSCAAP